MDKTRHFSIFDLGVGGLNFLHCETIAGDSFRPIFPRNFVIANERGDSVLRNSPIMHIDTTLTQSPAQP